MYRILIVDDEIYAVKGIVDAVDWKKLDILEVYEAYNANEAKAILSEEQIDLMICDIQMPVTSGLSLLEWANGEHPDLKTVFLTCHAEFNYAQKAMQLGSRDYLLKPVIYENLEEVIMKNLIEINEKRRSNTQTETFRKYYELWHEQKPELIQSFWRDIMSRSGDNQKGKFEQVIRAYDLPLTHPLLLILLSIEQWGKHLSAFDEELMNYALRKAAEEVIIPDCPGHVMEDDLGNILIIGYLPEDESFDREKWKQRCEEYIQACQLYFTCRLSCYVANAASIDVVGHNYHELLELEFSNAARQHQVLFHLDREKSNPHSEGISFLNWTESLEMGDFPSIEELAYETYEWIREQNGKKESLSKVYHGLLQVVYFVLLRKGISPDVLSGDIITIDPSEATRSSAHLKQWIEQIVKAVIALTDPRTEDSQSNEIVQKVQRYVKENLQDEITRDELSAYVHLNPSYLSRLFRLKTGLSISEYILRERMTKAAELLVLTNGTISNIAKSLGYDNFSYFSKMFKKVHRITPQEYRKSHLSNV
jgi:two-component system response regulator YesN